MPGGPCAPAFSFTHLTRTGKTRPVAAAAAGASDGARAAGSEVCGCVSHCPRVWGPWELSPRVGLLSAGFPLSWRAPRSPDCLAGGPAGGCPRSVMMRPPLARPCGKRSRESPTVRAVFRGGQTKHADGKPVRLKTGQPREVPPRPLPAGPYTLAAAGPVSSLRPSHGPLGSRPRKGGLSPLSSRVSGRSLTWTATC